MTKDAIIEEALMRIGNTDGTNEIGDYMSDAMSQWAKQQAIEYDFWKRQNGYTIDPSGEWYIKLTVVGNLANTKAVLVDEVYNQFIEQQNKP